MASSPSNSLAEPAKIEQVITEFFTKSLHIILESRSPYASSRNYSGDPFASSPSSSSSSSSGRPRDRWFNLALRDYPAALENFDLWRQSNLEPLVVDVVLVRRRSSTPDASPHLCPGRIVGSGRENFDLESKTEKVVERWIVQYESRKSGAAAAARDSYPKRSSGISSQSSEIPTLYKKTYKKSIVLLRSLYATVRLLPAYKVFRSLNSSGQLHPLSLSHRISSFVEPFTRAEDAEMAQFNFAAVDTPCGRLSLSVSYLPKLEDVSLENSVPLATQLITDYVGSPTTDPLKRFESLPLSGSVPRQISFTRRHSWSNDRGMTPSVSASPSPTYSETRALQCNPTPYAYPRGYVPDQSPSKCTDSHDASKAHKSNTGFDDYCPSPAFSPSTSPSPPTHMLSGGFGSSLSRCESAPVGMPSPRLARNQGLPPSPSLRAKKTGCCQADIVRAFTPCAYQTTSHESRLQIRKESPRVGDIPPSTALRKVLSFGRDGESGNLSGLSSSTRLTLPRSHSRLTFLDEDDSEVACLFAVDDEELPDSWNRSESSGREKGNLEPGGLLLAQRSPDAVVGAFVRMLKTAPPLRRDLSESVKTTQDSRDETGNQRTSQCNKDTVEGLKVDAATTSSGMTASMLFKSRTAADALEELMTYKEMKEQLLRRGGSQVLGTVCAEKTDRKDPSESVGTDCAEKDASKDPFESVGTDSAEKAASKDPSES